MKVHRKGTSSTISLNGAVQFFYIFKIKKRKNYFDYCDIYIYAQVKKEYIQLIYLFTTKLNPKMKNNFWPTTSQPKIQKADKSF